MSYRMDGRIKRRAVRQDPGTPETEAPRYRASRKTKKKHVHEWKQSELRVEKRKRHYIGFNGKKPVWKEIDVSVQMYYCKACGVRKQYRPYRWW